MKQAIGLLFRVVFQQYLFPLVPPYFFPETIEIVRMRCISHVVRMCISLCLTCASHAVWNVIIHFIKYKLLSHKIICFTLYLEVLKGRVCNIILV